MHNDHMCKRRSPGAEATLEILQLEEDSMGGCGEFDYRGWMASDDVKGGSLPAHLVHSARLKELKYLQDRKSI